MYVETQYFASQRNESKNIMTNILNLIPQRPPIVLVDGVVTSSEESTTTSFTVPEGHILVENGVLREPGLLENIAQSAAARAGYHLSLEGKEPQKGFIGDISNVEITRLPIVGATLSTTVTQLQQIFNITLVKGVIQEGGETIAQCEMKIVLMEEGATKPE